MDVSADRTASHRLMHNGILLRRVCVRNGGQKRNTKKNQQGELSEVYPVSYGSEFSAGSLFVATQIGYSQRLSDPSMGGRMQFWRYQGSGTGSAILRRTQLARRTGPRQPTVLVRKARPAVYDAHRPVLLASCR